MYESQFNFIYHHYYLFGFIHPYQTIYPDWKNQITVILGGYIDGRHQHFIIYANIIRDIATHDD